MQEAVALREFILTNVQDVTAATPFTAAPVLSGGNPANTNQLCTKAYVDTKMKIEDIAADSGLGYPQPDGAYTWYWQGGVNSVVTSAGGGGFSVFVITYPIAFTNACAPMIWFNPIAATGAEFSDSWLPSRGPTSFQGAIALTAPVTLNIGWLALGFGTPDWNTISL